MSFGNYNSPIEEEAEHYSTGAAIGSLAIDALCMLERNDDASRHDEHIQLALGNLREWTEFPFNAPGVLERYWQVAEQLNPGLAEFDFVLGDEISAVLPAVCFRRLVNTRRSRLGLPPAEVRFMNGRYPGELPAGFIPPRQEAEGKTLIVTDFISRGDSVNHLRAAVLAARPKEQITITAFYARKWRPTQLEGTTYCEPSLYDRGEEFIGRYMYGSEIRELLGRMKRRPTDLHSHQQHNYSKYNEHFQQRAYQDAELVADTFALLLEHANQQV